MPGASGSCSMQPSSPLPIPTSRPTRRLPPVAELSAASWIDRPWRLTPNRVSRFYRGGLLLDRFRGAADPSDTDQPEDWVGSVTRAWTAPGGTATDEGLSFADID